MQILLDKGGMGRLRHIKTALHLAFRWLTGPAPTGYFLQGQNRLAPLAFDAKGGTRTIRPFGCDLHLILQQAVCIGKGT